jgi:hypothetical protein
MNTEARAFDPLPRWRWMRLMLRCVRNALCPPPTVGGLLLACRTGALRLDDPPRKRRPQAAGLHAVIPDWFH